MEEILKTLIGMNKDTARNFCEQKNYKMRITKENSITYAITHDFCIHRINVEINNDIVVKCDIG